MFLIAGLWACLASAPEGPAAEPLEAPMPARAHPSGLDVVLLGTGTPVPDGARHGPATAVVFQGMPMVFDAGPGVVRRTQQAAELHGLAALEPGKIRLVFLTHLHSDHTTGLPDLILGAWVLGRSTPLTVVGPPGTQQLVDGILAAWQPDIRLRQTVEDLPPRGIQVVVQEVDTDGVVFERGGLSVRAFHVPHGAWEHAFGYRIDGGGRSVVISGDTDRSDAVAKACSGCDLLVHEVYSKRGFDRVGPSDFQTYHGSFHTSGVEVGQIAAQGQAKAVVLYHQLYFGDSDADLVREVRQSFDGPVVSGNDLDRF